MDGAINPSLTSLAMGLFHDSRSAEDEQRSAEVALTAENLSRCLLLAPTGHEGMRAQDDFRMLALMASHNALALADAARQRDRNGMFHWFLHLKESCQSCHEQFRFHRGENRLGAK
jgi:hypothetical protein